MANSRKSVAAGKPSRGQRVLSERKRAKRRNSVRPFQRVVLCELTPSMDVALVPSMDVCASREYARCESL